MKTPLTDYQAKYFAHELQRSYANDHVGKLAGLLFDAQVEPKPHQIDAALFALQTPFLPASRSPSSSPRQKKSKSFTKRLTITCNGHSCMRSPNLNAICPR
jgi:hypothetical protein